MSAEVWRREEERRGVSRYADIDIVSDSRPINHPSSSSVKHSSKSLKSNKIQEFRVSGTDKAERTTETQTTSWSWINSLLNGDPFHPANPATYTTQSRISRCCIEGCILEGNFQPLYCTRFSSPFLFTRSTVNRTNTLKKPRILKWISLINQCAMLLPWIKNTMQEGKSRAVEGLIDGGVGAQKKREREFALN